MLVLTYYTFFSAVTVFRFALQLSAGMNFPDLFRTNFICEAGGVENNCDRSQFEEQTYPGLVGLVQILAGLIPLANLTFVIHWRSVYTKFKQWKLEAITSQISNIKNAFSFIKSSPSTDEI